MARKVPAIIMEINEDGIEKLTVAAERDVKHQVEAAMFYADLTESIYQLDEAVKHRKNREAK